MSCPAGPYGWRPILIMSALFFSIGFITWLNGPLITFVQVAFNLDDVSAFLIPVCFYLAYLIFPLPATLLTKKIGLRRGIIVALLIMAAGMAIFGQYVNNGWYIGALSGLIVIGAGLSLLQITVNPYISLLGDHSQAAQRIAIMGVANKFAGIVAPVAFAVVVMPDVGSVASRLKAMSPGVDRDRIISDFTHAVYLPYQIMAGLLLLLALFVARAALPEITISEDSTQDTSSRKPASSGRFWGMTGALAMFLYVGVEVMAGDAIGFLGRSYGLSLDITKYLTSATLGSMLAGYLLGMIIVPRFISQERYLLFSCCLGILLGVFSLFLPGTLPVYCIALLGFANAMIMPALFPIVLAGAGSQGGQAVAWLVMAFSGGAIVPQIFVHIVPSVGVLLAFMLLVIPSYLFIGGWTLAFRKSINKNMETGLCREHNLDGVR